MIYSYLNLNLNLGRGILQMENLLLSAIEINHQGLKWSYISLNILDKYMLFIKGENKHQHHVKTEFHSAHGLV